MTHDHADIKAHILRTKPRWGYRYQKTNWEQVHKVVEEHLNLTQQKVTKP